MGNAQVPRYEEPWLLLSEYPDLAYQDLLASYKLFKVMRCRHEREELVVAKLFIHREGAPDLKAVRARILEVKDAFRSHWLHPNVVPYQGMEIGSQSAVLLRPHFARNLYDRMHMRPFLSECAKNWIAFQVLCGVCQAHSVGVAHGDLKTENVFVSSWYHAILSDFAIFKPLVLPRDDTSEFHFYFESNLVRRRCYLAPERFDVSSAAASGGGLLGGAGGAGGGGKKWRGPRFSEELAAMDTFSLGCVLAELFLDGQTLMDMPALLKYKSGQLDLTAKLAGIKSKAVQELIGSMLEREPGRRKSAIAYLREWCERVAPRAFRSCLFPLAVILLHPIYQHPDMRIALLRHNFAGLLWSTVGPKRLAAGLGLQAEGSGPSETWAAWRRHVQRRVRSIDAASLHGMAHSAAQSAVQRAEHLGRGIEVERPSPTDAPDPGAPAGAAGGAGGAGGRGRRLAPALAQPWLREDACEKFTTSVLDHWEAGCKRCVVAGSSASSASEAQRHQALQEGMASGIYGSFLNTLCTPPSPSSSSSSSAPAPGVRDDGGAEGEPLQPPGPGAAAPPLPEEQRSAGEGGGGGDDQEVLEILCGIICSALQHVRTPRMRMVCLDMLEAMAPFAPLCTVLEQIVPYCHMLMTDQVAKVRAHAIVSLPGILSHIAELPPSDSPLFLEYLFPQLLSAMSDMSREPVVLLAVAQNIGVLAQHALRFAESSVAAAQRGVGSPMRRQDPGAGAGAGDLGAGGAQRRGSGAALPKAAEAEASSSSAAAAEVEPFDVQWKKIREAVKKVVKALLEYLPSGGMPGPERPGFDGLGIEGGVAGPEDALLNLAMGREVKISLLRSMCDLADTFGRDGTHNFLLPYLISFMNDSAWEVRAAFCKEAASLPRKVGQISTEGIIWPCYEQALLDQEERVLEAALSGLAALVGERVLRRQSLANVASKVSALLVHPSGVIRARAVAVLEVLGEQMSSVDQYVFVMPTVRPFLQFELFGLDALDGALVPALSRRIFKRALLRRDEELHEALLHKRPLPPLPPASSCSFAEGGEDGGGEEGAAAAARRGVEADTEALELLRPYLQVLLRSRPSGAQQLAGAGGAGGVGGAGGPKDDFFLIGAAGALGGGGGVAALPGLLHTVHYPAVNPHCASNRSLQAIAEADEAPCEWPFASVQRMRHPLSLFSMQAFLTQALCLPPRPRDLGSLNYLDGTPYSIYATRAHLFDLSEDELRDGAGGTGGAGALQDSGFSPSGSVSVHDRRSGPSMGYVDLSESPEPPAPPGGGEAWLPSERSMGASSSERRATASSDALRRDAGLVGPLGSDTDDRGRGGGGGAGHGRSSWRPQGFLLATLYEYAHQGGVHVVKVDVTDDSRTLVTGGKDGVVKVWNCAKLERDVAVASSHSFAVPTSSPNVRQQLRALRTVRNSKAVAIGSECGDVLLYRIDSRGSTDAPQVCRASRSGGAAEHRPGGAGGAVMCLEQFDTELENLVVFARQNGAVQGWDLRRSSPCWSVQSVPPWLGVPSCLALGHDGHSVVIGTLGGGLLVYDLRFLAPWKQWRVASGAAALDMRSAHFCPSPSVFVALDSEANEVALFDVVRGSCSTLFRTEPVAAAGEPRRSASKEAPTSASGASASASGGGGGAVNVPTLRPAELSSGAGGAPEPLCSRASAARRSTGAVRSLWLPPRGAQTFLLAGGADRKVRHWSLDPEHHAADAYVVTPHDPLSSLDKGGGRTSYTSNHLGDVFVVQEQTASASRTDSPRRAGAGGGGGGGGGGGDLGAGGRAPEGRPAGPNPNHRDAILDMCTVSLQSDILVTAGRDGLVKLWR